VRKQSFPLQSLPNVSPIVRLQRPDLDHRWCTICARPQRNARKPRGIVGQDCRHAADRPAGGFIQKNARVKLVITTDYEESLARLVKGEADAAALGFHVGIRIAARLYPSQVTEPRSMFTELPFAVAVSKGREAEFLARLNVGLAAIRTDGTWQQINNRWMGN
jgi:hypothetical protein